ncbi:MAG: hypothetical protein AAGJ55_06215, partial [Cyanobacteria bacterium J06555_12]
TDFLNSAYGLEMKYVPYKGGGKVAKELAGKNANSTVNNVRMEDRDHLSLQVARRIVRLPERLLLSPGKAWPVTEAASSLCQGRLLLQ